MPARQKWFVYYLRSEPHAAWIAKQERYMRFANDPDFGIIGGLTTKKAALQLCKDARRGLA